MKSPKAPVVIVGGGLAGSEAAYQLARRGIPVRLYEMRPNRLTPAHKTGHLAELVCSNSLGADLLTSPAGILKAELRRMGSLIMRCADENRVPAGKALAVDRERFAISVSEALASCPLVEIVREEVKEMPEGLAIIATGPLTSGSMSEALRRLIGRDFLYFFDAVSPIVTAESIDFDVVFKASRYGEGEDYLNCPMDEVEYQRFWEALSSAERAPLHSFERDERYFEGCLPIEVMAKRGRDVMRYGPMRPVGLVDPKSGKTPYAVVQLRREDAEGTLYSLVGFQTNLKWSEQERVFRMIPGLQRAEFVRFGVMHRNVYVNAPLILNEDLSLRARRDIYLAGQIVGVEGYMESTAMGLVTALSAYSAILGLPLPRWPKETAIGSLLCYIINARADNFQPMNVNLGIFPPLGAKVRDRRKRCEAVARRALTALEQFMAEYSIIFDEVVIN
ncbi:MAG TPA: methylenetetrahydrofolate--tRNA-(uracil(54)-C(5))-methyltransferase (FADH(2)-oxidizing) TrmFO [Thermosynergistes sp.]|nr:methylenetetrahydrofolate--tRNA-(uracil(54)-C(5))-methyltransferase (FADH(2)-oxidizing) TrmFO [Thermosynergistes sp.]